MRIYFSLFFLSLLILLPDCNPETDCNKLADKIELQFNAGIFNTLKGLTDSLKKHCPEELSLIRKSDSLLEISGRIGIDFSITGEQVREKLINYKIEVNDNNFAGWEKKNWLECRVINGEKRYFSRTVSNLMLLNLFYENRAKREEAERNDKNLIFRKDHTAKVIQESNNNTKPVVPADMVITYTITVKPDMVPDGETIRCWLPFPKGDQIRQQNVNFISSSQEHFIIAPDSCIHRSVYMEEKSRKGEPTVFSTSFSYRSFAQYFNLSGIKILPYNKDGELYKKYTSEQLPQICFTEGVRKLADSITVAEDSPSEVVRKIYKWFKGNIPWTGALEYSIMPNIPEYVRMNRRGDCGMQTFLFMSMLRYKGIPVRWQSGWMVPPGGENLHDWCEVYYEGAGWVPVDVSYDLQLSEDVSVKEFYMSGIDSYRLIVNDGVAGQLFPQKKFIRSEPFDFQRGEVEWSGGNLYFDKWDYDIDIKYQEQEK